MYYPDSFLNRLVYDSVEPSYFHEKFNTTGIKLDVLPYYIPKNLEDITLIFESRFETGNLRRAIHVQDYTYDLILKQDTASEKGTTQWFYFSIANTRKNKLYTFNIINLIKSDSVYNLGLKLLMYSEKDAKEKNISWFRGGQNICYYQNNYKRKGSGYYFTLTF